MLCRMRFSRRTFLHQAGGAAALSLAHPPGVRAQRPDNHVLEAAATRPVLDLSGLNAPVIIDSIKLLRKGREYFLLVRSKDGAEGISLDNGRIQFLQPILERLVIPYFIGKDARELEQHLFATGRLVEHRCAQTLWYFKRSCLRAGGSRRACRCTRKLGR